MKENNLNKDLESKLELEIEKEKLKEVLSIIKEETEKVINKRKNFLNNLLEYRQKYIEEYRDDEDKIIEYFDHERFVTEEAFNLMDKKLKELVTLNSSPYFGRVDFREEDYGIEKIYIGRFGLLKEGEIEPIIVDWRAPVASLFYEGKLGEAKYKAPVGDVPVNILGRRQYIIKDSVLKGMFNSEIDVKDEILQMVLCKNSGDKLKDIVMTIQREQDQIIRESYLDTIVVDGVAGSGKTTIALHRIAYLLYNYRKQLQDKILILGPNGIFMEYISNVLPSLGETAVKQDTFWEMAQKLLNDELKVMPYKDYFENILKGNKELLEDFILKSDETYIDKLDNFLDKLQIDYFKARKIIFRGKTIFEEKEIDELFNKYYEYMPLFRRSAKIKRIIISKLKDIRDEEVRKINKNYKETINKLSDVELELNKNDLEFKRKIAIRDIIKELVNAKVALSWLDGEDIVNLYNKFNGYKRLTPEDLAGILYFKIKLEGYKLNEEIKHIVIDESQDLSKLQFIVIKEITGCNAFTILGDSNQRILPLKGKLAMKHLESIYKETKIKEFNLNKCYRSTQEIMEYANGFLNNKEIVPLVRNGEQVWEKEVNSTEVLKQCITDKLMRYVEKEYESIAVICESLDKCEEIYNLIKNKVHVRLLNSDELLYKSGIVIIPSYFAKGLEFDGVILVLNKKDDNENLYIDKGRVNYVMATRALHQLSVLKIEN